MSHAANLRRQQSQQLALPGKRRRLSAENGTPRFNGIGGLLNGHSSRKVLTAVPTHDAKRVKKIHIDESGVVISRGDADIDLVDAGKEVVEFPSDDSQNSAAEDSDYDGSSSERKDTLQNNLVGHHDVERDAEETEDAPTKFDAAGASTEEEPSFGDLLRARAPEPICVEASLAEQAATSKSLAPAIGHQLSVPSATSLGTVLTQALRTNDIDLLESCLQVPNLESIRATIERLHSSLAASLLLKLAERMHKRPGRAGSLMVWVQWTVVAHGGYLAGQPAAMKHLRTLYQVVKQRATGLQPLLALKGKLDMLEAQLQLRKNMQVRSRVSGANTEDDEAVIYVEGQEESSSGEEEKNNRDQLPKRGRSRRKGPRSDVAPAKAQEVPFVGDSEDDDAKLMPTLTNGIHASEDENDSEDGDNMELIDEEAEEADDDSDELSEEIDFEDVDEEEKDISDSEEEQRPTKLSNSSYSSPP